MRDSLHLDRPFGPFQGKNVTALLVAAALAACGGGGSTPAQAPQAEPEPGRARALGVTVNPAGWVAVPAPADALLQGMAIPATAPAQGMWSGVGAWPLNGLHQAVLPDGKVLTWGTAPDGNAQNGRYFDVWDPNRGLFDAGAHVTTYDAARQDSFCAAATYLTNGQLLITGGNGNVTSVAYNPRTGAMPSAGNVADSRWYATMINLADGRPIILGGIVPYSEGQWNNVAGALAEGLASMTPEVYENGAWRTLFNAQSRAAWGPDFLRASMPKAWLAPDGRVFGVSTDQMWYVDANAAGGQGTTTIVGGWKAAPSGAFNNDNAPNAGPTSTGVMYAPGKVLMVGGNAYHNGLGYAGSRQATVIDLNGGGAVRTEQPLMAFGRQYAGVVVLPDGKVLVAGGETRGNNDPAFGAYTAEMWNPATSTWARMAASTVFRGYHAQTSLLPNGTVLATGGGSPGPVQLRGDVFYPPYLFRTVNGVAQLAPRPRLVGLSGLSHAHGAQLQFDLASTDPLREAVLIGLSVGTHAFNSGQRRIPMQFTQEQFRITATVPANTLVPPGYYQLVAVDANGVPSRGTIVAIGQGVGAPQVPVTPYTPPDIGTGGTATPPAGAAACAAEGQTCTLPSGSTATVWFGADTRWVSRTGVTGSLACTVANFGDPAPGAAKSCVAVTASTLVGAWNFDATSGATAPDSSGGNRPLTLANTTLVAGRAGGQAVQFNGANASASTAGPLLDTAGSFTVATWVRLDALTGWRTMVNQDGAVASGFWLQYSEFLGNKFMLSMHDADAGGSAPFRAVGTTTPVAGRWYHVVGVRDRAAGTMRLYVDGRLEATTAYAGGWAANGSFNIGRGRFNGPNDWLAGALDDVRAFNTALTDAQVTSLFTATTPPPAPGGTPAAAWNFDATSGATAPDSSGGNRPLTLANTTLVAGRAGGQAVQFNGANASGSTAGPVLDTVGSFSVATWVRLDALTGWRTMVNQDAAVASGFWLQYSEFLGNKFMLSMHDADAGGSAPFRAVGTTTPVAGRWYHVVGVRDRAAGTMRLYVDGRLEATTAYAGGWAANGSFNIGRGRFNGPNDWLAGALDDVQAFTTALTDAQVAGLYGAATAGPVTIPAITAPPINAGGTATYTVAAQAGVSYSWDFGDGTPATPFGATASITRAFANPGVYGVTLTARDAAGRITTRIFLQAVGTPPTAGRPTASSAVALEARNGASSRLWVANPDSNTVAVIDTATNARVAEVRVGTSPRAVAIAPDGRVWVTNKGSSTISILSPATLAVAATVTLPAAAQPHGLAFAPGGSAFAVLEATGQLLKLDPATGAVQATLPVGANPRHVSATANGAMVLVSRFITNPLPGEGTATVNTAAGGAEVVAVNAGPMTINRTIVLRHSDKVDNENQGAGLPNYLAAAAISPDGTRAWVPSKQDNLLRGALRRGQPLDFQNTVRAISSRIDLATLAEDYASRIDHDNSSLGTAAAYHPSGAYLFVALETSRQVAVVDAFRGRELVKFGVGRAPQALAVSADGSRLYVQNFMDRTASVIDLGPLVREGLTQFPTVANVSTTGVDPLGSQVLLGKQLFYDARDPRLARDSYMSCASCHSDAGHDGRTWDFTQFGEGLRNTPALAGRAGMAHGFLHWSANFDEVQDFEGQIRALAGGTGLMPDAQFNAGTRNTPLGDRKAGLSADLDALAAYLGSLNTFEPSPSRNADRTLTAAALAGKAVFANANCVSCHAGAGFTLGGDAGALRNIGTLKSSSGARLGAVLTGIDPPTLRDVWKTAPYLHDGSAPTLAAAVQAHAGNTVAGADLGNLVAYLQQIGSEEPGPGTPPPANRAPTVSLTAPAGGTSMPSGTRVTLAATAADADGSVARVDFYAGSTLLGSDTTAPYTLSWTPAATGSNSLTARAFDNAGAATTSAAVAVSVLAPAASAPPASAVACAAEGGSCVLPGGATARVWYGAGSNWVSRTGVTGAIACTNEVFGDPIWGTFKGCRYQLTSTAPNQPPTVAVGAPASATLGNAVALTATAADADGTVARVEFLAGSTLLGSDTTAPYSVSWTPAAAGPYAVTARAFDNAGAATTSAAVTVTVAAGSAPLLPGALAEWTFDAAGGTTTPDSSGNGRTLALSSGVTYTPSGRAGTGLQFAGPASVAGATTAAPLVNTAGSFSVSGWIRFDQLPTCWNQVLASQDGVTVSGFYLGIVPPCNGGLPRAMFSMLSADADAGTNFRIIDTATIVTGTWYHLVAVRDATANTMTLYVNGRLAGTMTNSTKWAANGAFAVGRAKFSGEFRDRAYAAIDSVRVYGRALSAAEVTTLTQAAR